jgi:hypothetical protein
MIIVQYSVELRGSVLDIAEEARPYVAVRSVRIVMNRRVITHAGLCVVLEG